MNPKRVRFWALGAFFLPFSVFIFLLNSKLKADIYHDLLLHSVMLLVICGFAFYTAYFAYRSYEKNRDVRLFILALAFFIFGFSFFLHGMSISAFGLFNEIIFDVTEHYGLFLGSLILIGIILPIEKWRDGAYKNRAKIFFGLAFLLLISFIALVFLPDFAEGLEGLVNIFTGLTGILFVICLIFLIKIYAETGTVLLLHLILGFSILINTAIIPFFYREWNVLWWYFHLVFFLGFIVILLGLLKGREEIEEDFKRAFGETPIYRRIGTKLLLIFLLVGLLPVVLLGIFSIQAAEKQLEKEISHKLSLLAEAKEGQLFAYLDSIESRTVDFSSDGFIRDSLKEISTDGSGEAVEALNRYLISLIRDKQSSDPVLAGYMIIGLDGKVIAATESREIGKDESDDTYFKEGKKGVFTTDWKGHEHFGINRLFIVSAPLTDKETGGLLGVFINIIDTRRFFAILSGQFKPEKSALTSKSGITETLEVYLVNKEKNMFVNPFTSAAYRRTHGEEQSGEIVVDTLPVSECFEKTREIIDIYTNYQGEEVIGASKCIASHGWVLLSEIHASEAFIPIKEARFRLGLTTSGLAVLVVIIAFLFSQRIVRPIRRLYEGTEAVTRGNLDYRVAVRTGDEIEQLAGAFNKMTEDLYKSRVEITTYNRQLERKVKERTEELEEAKNKDEAILASIGDAVTACDKKGRVMLFNSAAEELTGFSAKEVMGKHYGKCLKFVFEDSRKPSDDFIAHAVNTGRRTKMENHTLIITKEGREIPVADSAAPIQDAQGNVIGCVVVFRDVTKEREIDRAKTEFVSLASHQLRTPLSTINWYTEMLLAEDVGKITREQKKYLEEIYHGSQRMVDLVNALLNVSRLELDIFLVEPEPCDVLSLVYSVMGELKPQIEGKRQLFTKIHEDSLPLLSADPKLLRMIFQNLLSNAVKYTPEKGEIKLDIRTIKAGEELDGRRINKYSMAIIISDSGFGIPVHQQDKIFSKLFRADNVREKDTDGTGLGLYIVKTIIDHAGGMIWFESEEDRGTTFYVTLPMSGMKKKEGSKPLG